MTDTDVRSVEDIYDEGDAVALCERAGVNPDEEITRFVLQDYAAVLIQMVESGRITDEHALLLLRGLRVGKLADMLLEVSHWTDIMESYAIMMGAIDAARARDSA